MKPATTSAASGSRIGSPSRAPASAAMHGERRPDVAARLHGVGQQHLAAEPLGLARLVRDHDQVDRHRDDHHDEAAAEISCGAVRPVRWLKALRSTSSMTSSRNTVTAAAATVSYFRWPYGWSSSGGRPRRADADQPDDVRRGVGERMEAVGQDADRAAGVAEAQSSPPRRARFSARTRTSTRATSV